jgi:hypothetical protein
MLTAFLCYIRYPNGKFPEGWHDRKTDKMRAGLPIWTAVWKQINSKREE